MIKILNIQPLPNYKLHIKYDDGVEGDLDLSGLVGKGVFEKFNDVNFFNKVFIGETGAPTWAGDLDIDVLNTYLKITGKSIDQIN